VCNQRCEAACTRHQVDEPVAVMALKRFVADWAWEYEKEGKPFDQAHGKVFADAVEIAPRSGYRVAVVGAGPAGLTAARDLNRLGHDVMVLEELPVAGGMMRVGIPGFRLPRERLEWDVDEVLAEGVQLRTNRRVEDVERLFDEGYDAVVLAVGLHVSRRVDIPGLDEPEGETWPGVLGAVEFLRRVNLGNLPDWRGRRVVVVGGGSTAMDTARFCRRVGAQVTVVYRRSRLEMPAHDFEIEDAEGEGVTLRLLANPVEVLRQGGAVTAVRCVQMELGEPDESGRRRPIAIPGSEFDVPADAMILAIGQDSDLGLLPQDGAVTHQRGVVQHDPHTLMTARAGLFVAGDVAGTDGFVVDAIATGSQAARAVDRYLRGAGGAPEPLCQPPAQLDASQVRQRLGWAAPQNSARARSRTTLPEVLWHDFEETALGLSEAEALAESARCLSCGLCSECLACVSVCPANAIDHEQQARTLVVQADVVLGSREVGNWASGELQSPERSGVGIGNLLGVDLPGVRIVDDDAGMAEAVDEILAGFDPVPAPAVAAPSRWPLATRHSPLAVFLCRCGGEIERVVDLDAVESRVGALPGVGLVERIDFACHPEGNAAIRAALSAHDLPGGVLAACSCCALDQVCYSCTTQRTRCKEQLGVWDDLNGLPLQFVNVREQCAFVHRDDPAAATLKAGDLIAASLAAQSLLPTPYSLLPTPYSLLPNSLIPHSPITAVVDPVRCRECDDCVKACGLQAIAVVGTDGARVARVDAARCLGCGVCMTVCSSGAIVAGDTSDAQAEAMLAALGDLGEKTLVFSCNWGAYSAVEAAGVQGLAYDASVRLLRVMCAGRVHAGLILRAFAQGAARVLVLACAHEDGEPGCHYHTGSEQAARSVEQAQGLLDLLGIDPARLALAHLHPGDGAGFVATVNEFVTKG
jgi:NADPH-dependent glutamate synthase beta subunit-like oxidoreductase/coenzyme F420-reducing hydrogenase delta subunit/ferredoxin